MTATLDLILTVLAFMLRLTELVVDLIAVVARAVHVGRETFGGDRGATGIQEASERKLTPQAQRALDEAEERRRLEEESRGTDDSARPSA